MPAKLYVIRLSPEERSDLEEIVDSGIAGVEKKLHAQILLLSDTERSREEGASRTDKEISEELKCRPQTVSNARKRAWKYGIFESIGRQSQPKPPEVESENQDEKPTEPSTSSDPTEEGQSETEKLTPEQSLYLSTVRFISKYPQLFAHLERAMCAEQKHGR